MSIPTKSSDVIGGYTPTEADKIAIRPKKDMWKISGDSVFHTIQGEGDRAGRPTTFVRLHLCNLKCAWCDAWYTWRSDTEEYYKEPKDIPYEDLIKMIVDEQTKKGVKKMVYDITFTGGEPLLHKGLIERFAGDNPFHYIQIETNGTIMPSEYLLKRCKFNCSPKLAMSGNGFARYQEKVLTALNGVNSIFKFVFRNKEDIDEVLDKYSFLDRGNIWFMPEGVTKEENAKVFEDTIDYILGTGCNVAIRGQNIMWDGAKRGV